MIRVLGAKRVIILVVLLAVNAALIAGVYMYLAPEKIKKERELRSVRGQIAGLSGDIDRLQVEFDQLEDQQAEFERLKKRGFFSDQGRREAERILERIQQEANVISAVASIQAGEFLQDEEASKASHEILRSPISVRVEALDDIDVYRYIYMVEKAFPGHVSLKKLNLSRKSDITGTILRAIASGSNPPLVQADIELTWHTMIPALPTTNEQGGQF